MRKPRPLSRDTGSLRDTRLFIVACDDTYAPKQYFGFFRNPRVQVHVVPTEDGRCDAQHVLGRLRAFDHEDDDELWLLLDTDHYTQGTHLLNFTAALKEARQQGIHVALSKPSFEIWLLLHRLEEGAIGLSWNANEVAAALRANLGHYNKTNLQPEDYRPHVLDAYKRAKRLDEATAGGEIPGTSTSRVYQLWESIVASALPAQLPPELRGLLELIEPAQ